MNWKFLPFCLLFFTSINAQNQLYITNPQGWGFDQGTIQDAELHIKPQGIYMEYGLYLTISPFQNPFDPLEQLEIVLDFALPQEAHIIDSWLWVEEDIIQADLIDRWTASQIYEDIVDRRQDPSILFKNGNGSYRLRIYPLFSDSNRKVKITYLMPTRWHNGKAQVDLPIDLLRTAATPTGLTVRTFLPPNWTNPTFLSDRTDDFIPTSNPTFGSFHESVINEEVIWEERPVFQVQSPMTDGVYLSTYTESDENFYQLVYQPSSTEDLREPKKVAVLVDYQAGNSTRNAADVLSEIEAQLIAELQPTDFFNVLVSDINIQYASDGWIAATDEAISEAISNAKDDLVQYSNLPSLLSAGIEFAQDNDGSVYLIANSGNFGELEAANSLLDNLNELLDEEEVPVHVSDFHNRNVRYNFFGNQNFPGNQYFYSRLTGRTGGEFTSMYNDYNGTVNFSNQLISVIDQLQNVNANFDLHTDVAGGFCYGRYNLNSRNTVNRPFIQIGKFSGEMPFSIELAGSYNGQLFIEEAEVDNAINGNASLRQSWIGQWINEQEFLQSGVNSGINNIINVSMEERVLSRYTAFLALEPSQGGEVCQTCDNPENGGSGVDGGDGGDCCVTAVDEPDVNGISTLTASPNPFREQTTIQLVLDEDWTDSKAQIHIYNQLGQLVFSFSEQDLRANEEYTFTWNGVDANGQPLPKGIYFFSIQTDAGVQVLKLVYQ